MPSWRDSRYEGTAETRSWIQAEPMTRGRAGHVPAVLADGTVLVAGGFEAGTAAHARGDGQETPVVTLRSQSEVDTEALPG